MTNNIFINYRREDSSGYSLAIYNELVKWYDREMIFKDFNTIEPGEDFSESIENALNSCTILLVLVANNWMDILKKREELRGEPDFVRMEIATALSKGVYTIPIVLNRANILIEDELPDDLKKIAKRQCLDLDPTRFETDILKLVKVIDKKLNIHRNGPTIQESTKPGSIPQQDIPIKEVKNILVKEVKSDVTDYVNMHTNNREILKRNFKTWTWFVIIAAAANLIALLLINNMIHT